MKPAAAFTIAAEHPTRGRLLAHVDPEARFVSGKVADNKLGALLAPYPDRAAAERALTEAGAKILDPAQ